MADGLAASLLLQKRRSAPDLPWVTRDFLYQAKHFTLDKQASDRLVEMVAFHSDLINELGEFAISPFPKMTVEMDMPYDKRDGSGRAVTRAMFSIEGEKWAWMYSAMDPDGRPGFFLESCNDIEPRPGVSRELQQEQVIVGAYFISAFCLILQAKRASVVSESPKGRMLIKGRPVPYFARSVITISLDPTRGLKRAIATGARGSPRRHPVMGHFVHRGGRRHGCTHAWEPVEHEDGKRRWTCSHCERKRTWRAAFERGDAGKGFVMSSYKVTG